MKKEDLLNAVQHMPKPVKPKIPKAAVAGFIAGGVAVAAAASAVGYFFLKKKEITLHLCCDISDHDEDECCFEEDSDAAAESKAEKTVKPAKAVKAEKTVKIPVEPPLGAFADTFGSLVDDEPVAKPAARGEEVPESAESPRG